MILKAAVKKKSCLPSAERVIFDVPGQTIFECFFATQKIEVVVLEWTVVCLSGRLIAKLKEKNVKKNNLRTGRVYSNWVTRVTANKKFFNRSLIGIRIY